MYIDTHTKTCVYALAFAWTKAYMSVDASVLACVRATSTRTHTHAFARVPSYACIRRHEEERRKVVMISTRITRYIPPTCGDRSRGGLSFTLEGHIPQKAAGT